MKLPVHGWALVAAFLLEGFYFSPSASAATTIDVTNQFTYGANVGWMDWRGDTTNGAVIGEYVCSGSIYSANVGWISLGSGLPTNGIRYQNNSSNDFGVNHDGVGNLRGFAYGANIGWINFETNGAARVDLVSGRLSGWAYSANCGWISLSNTFAALQTDFIQPGIDADGDGMADAWELLNFNTLTNGADEDPDGDGASNLEEYLAGSDPQDIDSNLRITDFKFATEGTDASLTWTSVTNRHYYVERSPELGDSASWNASALILPANGATTTTSVVDTNAPNRFYRVRAIRPLAP